MGKAARGKSPTTYAEGDIERSLAIYAAKKQFMTYALNMGWQLAITILVPVFIGVKLDQRFDSSPSYTLASLFLAVGMSIFVIANTIKQVNKENKT